MSTTIKRIWDFLSNDADMFFGGEKGANEWMDRQIRYKERSHLFNKNGKLKNVEDDDILALTDIKAPYNAVLNIVAKFVENGIEIDDIFADIRFLQSLYNKKYKERQILELKNTIKDAFNNVKGVTEKIDKKKVNIVNEMKWELNRRTGRMEPVKAHGFRVSGRIGGIMVEDFDKNIQFLIHYGTDEVIHCVGCSGRDLHIFDTLTAKKIASEIERVARSHNATTKYSDYRYICNATRNFNESKKVGGSMDNTYQLSLLINRLYTASKPYTQHGYSDNDWQKVYEHVNALRKVTGVVDITRWAGVYHNYFAGTSPDINHPAYREYKLEIDTLYGIVEGRLICHSAGREDDVFSRYDMTCTFWIKNEE